ncbi:MAG: CoA ester lyase [Armatimonadetes bacterium]|nr:CoA ester lyase [Armatimonadota bacterium]
MDGSPAGEPFGSGGQDPGSGSCRDQRRVPVFVRVNAVSSPHILKDLEAVVDLPIEGIMLAKAESGEEVRRADWLLGLLEREKGIAPGRLVIIPFVESARGIEQAAEIAGACARVWCLAFGGNDYTMDIGTTYSPEGAEQFYARCRLVTASRLAGIAPPLDTVNPDFRNIPALVEEVKRVKQLGFQGKLVIHPAQVRPVNEVFNPSPAEVEWAKKVVAAFAQAQAAGAGVIQLEGKMVELPVVRRAQQILHLKETILNNPSG